MPERVRTRFAVRTLDGAFPEPGPPPLGDEVVLWWLDTDREVVGGYPVASQEAPLSPAERERSARLRRPADRHRYRAAHVGLRLILGGYTGLAAEAVRLAREGCPCCGEPHGRPALADAGPHFSLSHSCGRALIAVSGVRVGADVEGVPQPAIAEELLPALHPREQRALRALPDADRPAVLARIWTRKEAYLKATGVGLAYGVADPYVGASAVPAAQRKFTVHDVAAPSSFAAAIALATAG
ncbi:4'-phosphopantetheinyl transferase family protein [Streptacidiphilus neutrinimicus]|uniref:4'-phosphopantetheinyl transferase family protein n=1 Tax=Streptacidiphilus neutrinimicus TaxID=105420 RepID=UPI0007C86EBD|nr:4'-phosphopantetheinyl transferase superfamily protein [Streptacidiphilus neutrinimicus]